MLVLSRKPGEKVVLDNITITVLGMQGSNIRLGFEAPASVNIVRGELAARQGVRPTSTRPKAARPQPRRRPVGRNGSARVKD
jgi:carbon storage regulator